MKTYRPMTQRTDALLHANANPCKMFHAERASTDRLRVGHLRPLGHVRGHLFKDLDPSLASSAATRPDRGK